MMNGASSHSKSIGIWMSDKKSQKLNWKELARACASHGYNLIKVPFIVLITSLSKSTLLVIKYIQNAIILSIVLSNCFCTILHTKTEKAAILKQRLSYKQ